MPIKMDLKGVKELQAALAKVAPEAKAQLQADLKAIGALVQADVQAEMPRRKGKAKRSVKVKVVQRRGGEGVQISEGGSVAPYAPWLDFGGTVGRGRRATARVTLHGNGRVSVRRGGSRSSGSVVRPFIKEGRYLYPAYERRYAEMVAAAFDAVHKAAVAAGLEVKS